MATDGEDSGFLARWSRRKVQVRDGAAVAEVPVVTPATAPIATPVPLSDAGTDGAAAETPTEPPAPTLADVAELTRDSDFSRFVTRSVQPEVKNAALKKLFTDPHFNIMDGLDTYIDDYGIPDPLPEGMLRQMTQAKFLGLFTDEEEDKPAPAVERGAEILAPTTADTPAETAPDEDTDLRLQPHDDAGRAGPEPGAVQDTGREH